MAFVLGHTSAREFLLMEKANCHVPEAMASTPSVCDAPSGPAWERVARRLESYGISAPYDVMISAPRQVRGSQPVRCHVNSFELPDNSFCYGIDPCVAFAGPELSFVQMAASNDPIDTLLYACALCSSFSPNELSPTGVVPSTPQSCAASLREYASRAQGIAGVQEARHLSRYVIDGAASPMEIVVGMMFALPSKLGGYAFPLPQLNAEIGIDHGRKTTRKDWYRADFCWPAQKVIVEYNGGYHFTEDQHMADANRRNDLEDLGYRVIEVSKSHLQDRNNWNAMILQLGKVLGIRNTRGRLLLTPERRSLLERLCSTDFWNAWPR